MALFNFGQDNSPDAHLKNPIATQKWIKELPEANPGEITRLVLETLQASNRIENFPKQRLGVLETLYPKIQDASENLGKYYNDISFPLTTKMQKIIDITENLLMEASRGYLQIIHDYETKQALDKKGIALTIYRALEYFSHYLLRVVQHYAEVRIGTWKSIHSLYLQSTELKIDHIKVKVDSSVNTVEDIYKQIILLFLLSPYGLGSSQVLQLYKIAADWIGYTNLSTDKPEDKRHLVLNMANDDPPQMSNDAFKPKNMRYFVVEDLINKLEEIRFQLETSQTIKDPVEGEAESQLNQLELVTRAINFLSLAVTRRNPREKLQNVHALVIVGVENIHFGLQNMSTINKKKKPVRKSSPHTLDYHDIDQRILNTSRKDLFNDLKNSAYQDNPNNTLSITSASIKPIFKRWEVINKSVSGCALRWMDTEMTTDVRVGKLVTIKIEGDEGTPWKLGVVRRMQFHKKRLEIGIEFLGENMIPISIFQLGEAVYKNGLYVPADHEVKQPERIILPTYAYKTSDKIGIKFPNKEEHVELTRIISYTASFTIFRFKILTRNFTNHEQEQLSMQKNTKVQNVERDEDKTDDNSFWSSL